MNADNVSPKGVLPTKPIRGRRRWQFLGFAIGTLLATATLPQTRPWMARQLHTAFVDGSKALAGTEPAAVAADPPDAAIRLRYQHAAAMLASDEAAQVSFVNSAFDRIIPPPEMHNISVQDVERRRRNLAKLTERFPTSPLPLAAYLRYMGNYCAPLHRPEEYLLDNKPVPDDRGKIGPSADSAGLTAAFLRIAKEGERIDPRNAFFPLMQATAYYSAYQDKEGLEALSRAAEKPEWREYTSEELAGAWRLNETVFGRGSELERLVTAYRMLFPQYSQYRAVFRPALWQAVSCEKRGDYRGGLAIRGRLMRLAATMRSQATTNIGGWMADSLLFMAGDYVSADRPPKNATSQEQRRFLAHHYLAYLDAHGYKSEATWFASQVDRYDGSLNLADSQVHAALLKTWAVALYSLIEIAAIAVLGVSAFAFAYSRRFDMRKENGLIRLIGVGIAIGSIGIGVVYAMDAGAVSGLTLLGCTVVLLAPLLILCAVARGERPLFLWAYVTFTALGLLVVLTHQAAAEANQFIFTVNRLLSLDGNGAVQASAGRPEFIATIGLLVVPVVVALSALMFHGARFVFRTKGAAQPVLLDATRSFAAAAVPALAICMIVYTSAIFVTTRKEAVMGRYLDNVVRNEPEAMKVYPEYFRPLAQAGR